jgi:hypothetical protein
MLAGACAGAPLTDIGDGWYIDPRTPGKSAARLFYEVEGTRVLVDRQIEAYRLYYGRCLVYQVSRAEGPVLFLGLGANTPIAVVASEALNPWRLDGDGLRRFERPADADGRNLLKIETIKVSDVCNVMHLQPPLTANWAAGARVTPGRFKIEQSVLDVNGGDSVGNSTLSAAVDKGQIATIDELLRAGADANSSNDAGITVLMVAVVHRQHEAVGRLLDGGARINAQDDRGKTALMWAAAYRDPDIAHLLLERGADASIRDDAGQNAATWVQDGGTTESARLRELLRRPAAAGR